MENTTIAVDVAKSVFEIAVSEKPGRGTGHHRLSRNTFLPFFVQRPPATVLMEACGSAQYWARQIEAKGDDLVALNVTPRGQRTIRIARVRPA